jgi:hypothetical protein
MNNCSCVYVGDYNRTNFYDSKSIKASKSHECCECGGRILPGNHYEKISGNWGGVFSHFTTCLDCVAIRAAIFCEGWHFEVLFDNLIEHIRETGGEISEDCLAGLPPRARGLVCDLIQDYWESMGELSS